MKTYRIVNFLLVALLPYFSLAQDDLLGDLEALTEDTTEINYATATFKSTRIINGQSVEMPGKNELLFVISHRFGSVEEGAYDLFGLDAATIRLGFEYTLPTDFVCISVGRSSYGKTFDGGIKFKLLRQKSGYRNFPFTIDFYSAAALSSLRFTDTSRENYFSSRLAYAHQLLIATKISDAISIQISPMALHKNLVATNEEYNTFYGIGIGGRYKFVRRVALTFEYNYFITPEEHLPQVGGVTPIPTISIGFDIETGGHVFSLAFTNARAMYDPGIYSETTQSWSDMGVHFGFNVNRTFNFGK